MIGELLARSIVITRRASGTDHPIVPMIRLRGRRPGVLNGGPGPDEQPDS